MAKITDKKKTAKNTKKVPAANRNQQNAKKKQDRIVPSADDLKYKADDERITKRMETSAKLATRMNNSKAAKTAGRRTQSRIIPSPEELEKTSKKPKW